ncbi:MAG TPA: lipocalin family protein [Methylibium sp.]|nr:lipocalin family protein [Methylibium sp.]
MKIAAAAGLLLGLLAACQTTPPRAPIALAPQVDLPRFMGRWYVIAAIPTWPERDAYEAVESYRLRDDGRIATTFTFRRGSFEAPLKTMEPVGTVADTRSNAVWTMQFVWPFEADYRIVHVDPAHTEVIVGREKRDYVWIMARTPTLPDADYQRLVGIVAAQGYDTAKLRLVPQKRPG